MISPGDQVRVLVRDDNKVWTVDGILPGGQVNCSREVHPTEKMWAGYQHWLQAANARGVKRVHLQVHSVAHLEKIEKKGKR